MTKAMPMYTDGRPLGSPMGRMGAADDMAAAAICERWEKKALMCFLAHPPLPSLPLPSHPLPSPPLPSRIPSPTAHPRPLFPRLGMGHRRNPPCRRRRADNARASRRGAKVRLVLPVVRTYTARKLETCIVLYSRLVVFPFRLRSPRPRLPTLQRARASACPTTCQPAPRAPPPPPASP